MNRTEEILERWAEWLPPSPHREAVAEFVARGRASIVQPDPDQPPRLMFEDGGSFILPDVRYDGQEPFYSVQRPDAPPDPEFRATKYSDVCGNINEFKRLVADNSPVFRDDPDYIRERFDDIRYMISRMYRRQREYTQFAEELRALADRLAAVPIVDRAPADEGLAELERMLENPECVAAGKDRLDELAEQVRAVASAQENRLREHKEVAIELFRAYRRVKGPRDWTNEESAEPEDE
ncbi:MAG: hypothetical protein J7M38_07255 [Armatimonadetes bacterium]|nr:hypothetical protein [Armatimonadota bacterium]